ncbi:MAG: DUF4352 domain-containing protein [Chloroflexi bacterium]|nr:DUF4352 domain-containing protein [Chloroflexota bacterium]
MRQKRNRFFMIIGVTVLFIILVTTVNQLYVQPMQAPKKMATATAKVFFATQTAATGSEAVEWMGIPNISTSNQTWDGLRVEIMRVDDDAWPLVHLENKFNEAPPPDERMLMLTLQVTNVAGEETMQIREALFRVIDEQRQPYTTFDADTRCGVIPQPLKGTLPRGESLTGNICIQVPLTSHAFVLEHIPTGVNAQSTYFRVPEPGQ